jgi:glycosyltransferase involved in cell wall biosynthesis
MNSPEFIEAPGGQRAQVIRREAWREVRDLLGVADILVIDCRDLLIYRLAAHFLLFPWTRKPLIAVDLVLRKPLRLRHRLTALFKRVLLKRIDHFIHYFKDISGYTRYFGIQQARSSYVPFKVNIRDLQPSSGGVREEYIFTMGVSLRDYDTFIRAVAALPYRAAIPEFSFEHFEGRDRRFTWTKENIPPNLLILPDCGDQQDLLRNLSRARLVVVPTQADSLCASGISTYLDAMYLGKCVITSSGPGASDVLTDQALLVPPHDVTALQAAICRAWEDDALRRRTAESGYRYARSLGGEAELLQRVFQQCFRALMHQPASGTDH